MKGGRPGGGKLSSRGGSIGSVGKKHGSGASRLSRTSEKRKATEGRAEQGTRTAGKGPGQTGKTE